MEKEVDRVKVDKISVGPLQVRNIDSPCPLSVGQDEQPYRGRPPTLVVPGISGCLCLPAGACCGSDCCPFLCMALREWVTGSALAVPGLGHGLWPPALQQASGVSVGMHRAETLPAKDWTSLTHPKVIITGTETRRKRSVTYWFLFLLMLLLALIANCSLMLSEHLNKGSDPYSWLLKP